MHFFVKYHSYLFFSWKATVFIKQQNQKWWLKNFTLFKCYESLKPFSLHPFRFFAWPTLTTVVFHSIFLLFVNFPWISTVRVVQHSYAQAGLGILHKEQQILSKNLCLQNFAPRIRWKKAPRKYFKINFFLLSSLYLIEMKCDFVQRCRKKSCIVWSQIHGGSHVKNRANDPKNPLKMRFLGFLR